MIDAAYISDPNARSPSQGRTAARLRSSKASRGSRAPRRRGSFLTGLASGIAGFVIGAVFWHFVGFWSFVSDVILKGPPEEPKIRSESGLPSQQPIKVAGRLRDAVRFRDLGMSAGYLQAAAGAGNCAEVRIERTTGQASVQACALGGSQLPLAGAGERTDRLVDSASLRNAPAGWTVQVQAGD